MLYIHRTLPTPKEPPAAKRPPLTLPDPWQTTEPDDSADGNNWLLSYADLVTLLFALFVLLCAHQKIMLDQSAKADVNTNPAVIATVAPNKTAELPSPRNAPSVAAPEALAETSTPASHVEVLTVPVKTAQSDVNLSPTPVQMDSIPPAPATVTAALPQTSQWLAMPPQAVPLTPPTPISSKLSQADWNRWVEFSANDEKVRLEVNDKILFDPASSKLKPEGLLVLDSLANWLRLQAGQIDVEGHTDNSPISTLKFGSNWELSSARASAVTRHLISRGLTPERIKAVGLADTQPRNSNDTPEGRAKNRRVSLVLYLLKQGGMNI